MIFPIVHTNFDILQSTITAEKLADRLVELDIPGAIIADHTLSGSVQFIKALKRVGKKAIIGQTFTVSYDDGRVKPEIWAAKSIDGWKSLLKLNALIEDGKIPRSTVIDHENGIEELPAFNQTYYLNADDYDDHHILLATKLKSSFDTIHNVFKGENEWFKMFWESNEYYLNKDYGVEFEAEDYSIFHKPQLPHFDTGKLNADEYLKKICREGWIAKIQTKVPKELHNTYADRIKLEFEVIEKAQLSVYFLIIADLMNFLRSKGFLLGCGRGSSAGCLISYLCGITQVDPVKYHLLFERFYNEGRNTADNISLPDIDVDMPTAAREVAINYLKDKYGTERVMSIITFGTLVGRSAMKAVLHAYGNISFSEMNAITKWIPDKAEISDELQEMEEEEGESSVIKWSLENNATHLKDWCYLDKNNVCQGPLAKRFEQAIRLEGLKATESRHPSGIIIAPDNLENLCPLTRDKDGNLISALELKDADALGIVKYDILGVAILQKIKAVPDILKNGDIYV